MIQSYFRGSMGYIFVFDISNRESLMELKSFIEDVATYRREHPSILVGNKCDLDSDRAVSIEEAQVIFLSVFNIFVYVITLGSFSSLTFRLLLLALTCPT